MELNKDLQSLIETAESLHGRLSHEIENSIEFCRFCSEHGRFCTIAETTPFEERERLIAIRDLMKEVEDMLKVLQIDRHAALSLIEESRLVLVEKATQHQGEAVEVVKELKASFGNENNAFNWNWHERMEEKVEPHDHKRKGLIAGFISRYVSVLFKPWKWEEAVGNAVKLIVASASISSTILLYKTRKEYCSSKRKILSYVDSTKEGKSDSLLTISKSPLDVFYGRG